MRSRKSRGERGYSCGSASARGVSNDTSSSSCAGGVVDSLDLALLSSVSANVIRLLGVSNDLRDRGDEWPLRKVVKGLSVVVATVVDEVSMFFCSAAPSARACLGPIFDYVAAASSLQLALAVSLRSAADLSNRCAIARSRSNAAVRRAGQIWLSSLLASCKTLASSRKASKGVSEVSEGWKGRVDASFLSFAGTDCV